MGTAASPNCKIHSISVLPSLPLGAAISVPEQMGKAFSELGTLTLPVLVLLWVPGKGSLSVYTLFFSLPSLTKTWVIVLSYLLFLVSM